MLARQRPATATATTTSLSFRLSGLRRWGGVVGFDAGGKALWLPLGRPRPKVAKSAADNHHPSNGCQRSVPRCLLGHSSACPSFPTPSRCSENAYSDDIEGPNSTLSIQDAAGTPLSGRVVDRTAGSNKPLQVLYIADNGYITVLRPREFVQSGDEQHCLLRPHRIHHSSRRQKSSSYLQRL